MRKMWILLLVLTSLTLIACGEDHEHDLDQETSQWNQAYEDRNSGKADGAQSCSGVTLPDQGDFNGRVALTFDDGPNPATTPAILDTLKEEGIQATFFINGKRVKSDTERAILARIVDEGHILANHSHSHNNFAEMSRSTADTQIAKTHEIIKEAGVEPAFFRFPYGSSTCDTAQQARDYGYAVTGWHVDSADWCFASSTGGVGRCAATTFRWVPDGFRNDMVAYTLHQTKSNNGGILLFHDIHQNTVNSLQPIIDGLRDGGYTFTNIDDGLSFPRLNGFEPPFVGDLCSLEEDCAFRNGQETGSCYTHQFETLDEETPDAEPQPFGFCTLNCEGYCPDASGKAPTFCASLDNGVTGSCLSKASSLNQECATLAGTAAKEMDRFIGTSTASASTAVVCFPSE